MAYKDYNPYEDVLSNYKLKSNYDYAKSKGDTAGMQKASQEAEAIRKRMTDAGYGDLADRLKGTDTAGAKLIADQYAKFGKTQFRPYLYNSKLSTQYGLTNQQIDDLIKYDDTTKEISFGGKNIGRADSLVDGASYWDSSYLDTVVDDYIKTSGIQPTMTSSQLMDRSNFDATTNAQNLFDKQMRTNDDINAKFKELYGYSMNTNPFDTEVGKAIMDKYDLKALQGRDNEVASGAGSNSGNIDSFSAANALRQQTAITAQGQQMVMQDQQNRINNTLAVLSGMTDSNVAQDAGMQNTITLQHNKAGRLFDEEEASKINDHTINVDVANVTGYVPQAWENKNNPYLNDDGTFAVDPNTIDFAQKITDIDTALKTETDPTKRAELETERRYLVDARNAKVKLPQYSKYASQIFSNAPQSTLARDQMDVTAALTDKELDITNSLGLAEVAADNYRTSVDASGGKKLTRTDLESFIKNGSFNQDTLDAYNAMTGMNYTMDNPPPFAYSALGDDYSPEGDETEGASAEEWDAFLGEFDKESVSNFLTDYIRPLYFGDTLPSEEQLKNLILENTEAYDIDVEDARKIMSRYRYDTSWLNGYTDRTWFNKNKGMTEKK